MTTIEQALSPIKLGATYAMIEGDLETAISLGLESLSRDAYSQEVYVLLALAYSGLGLWEYTAEYARLAICFGVRDARLGALLAGLYSRIDMAVEADWVSTHCDTFPLDLSQAISPDDAAKVQRCLAMPPSLPKRHKANQNHQSSSDTDHDHQPASFSWGETTHSAQLPSWMEASDQINHTDMAQVAESSLEWLVSIEDHLEGLMEGSSELPDWLERSDGYEDLFLEQGLVQMHSQSAKIDHIPASKEETDDRLQLSTEAINHGAVNEAQAQAEALGLGSHFLIAINLDALTLSQEGTQPKRLFGPLLLALVEERLIIAAYEGDMMRQRPWAFTKEQLLTVKTTDNQISLLVEGDRTILFDVGSQKLSEQLTQIIRRW
jgi:hypothetical protein